MSFSISYVISTRNRLPFLRITLERLISELLPDEEIAVVDGNSTDGTKEYLQQLFEEGKIHQFVSEPDHNQAHAWNKVMLMARGTILKKIMDDDVFAYDAIRACKNLMLSSPEIDICISNVLNTNLTEPENITFGSRLDYFNEWKDRKAGCFTFSDVYMLVRRSSLSYLGLYDVQFSQIDWEYALRCSYLKARIAYYTGCNALSVDRPGNVTSARTKEIIKLQADIVKVKYGYEGDFARMSLWSKIKIAVGKMIGYQKGKQAVKQKQAAGDLAATYEEFYSILEKYNREHTGDFFVS